MMAWSIRNEAWIIPVYAVLVVAGCFLLAWMIVRWTR